MLCHDEGWQSRTGCGIVHKAVKGWHRMAKSKSNIDGTVRNNRSLPCAGLHCSFLTSRCEKPREQLVYASAHNMSTSLGRPSAPRRVRSSNIYYISIVLISYPRASAVHCFTAQSSSLQGQSAQPSV
jgi:hypothetical protein